MARGSLGLLNLKPEPPCRFIPMFGPAGSDIGLHLLNGLAAVGLAYLFIIVTVFNLQV